MSLKSCDEANLKELESKKSFYLKSLFQGFINLKTMF